MKEQFNYSEVPAYYPVCLNTECPKANSCLRQMAQQVMPDTITQCTILNPKYLASVGDDCPHYRSSSKVRYAKGFIHLLDNLPRKQMLRVIEHLSRHFNPRTYYRVRKGERLLSPQEQEEILFILRKYNGSIPLEFDAYEEKYSW